MQTSHNQKDVLLLAKEYLNKGQIEKSLELLEQVRIQDTDIANLELFTECLTLFDGILGSKNEAELEDLCSQCKKTIEKAALALPNDFAPIDDVRATSQYRMLLAQNLLHKFFEEQKK